MKTNSFLTNRSAMSRALFAAAMFAMTAMLTGCGFGGNSTAYTDRDILGRWEGPSQDVLEDVETENPKIVFVFLNDKCVLYDTTYTEIVDTVTGEKRDSMTVTENDYGKWGYTFDEGNDVHEEDLLSQAADGSYHKNGWFGWTLQRNEINTFQMTSVGKAGVPFTYTIVSHEGNTMTLREGYIATHKLTKVDK